MDIEIEPAVAVPVATLGGEDELMDFDEDVDAAIDVDDESQEVIVAEEDTEMRDEPVLSVSVSQDHTPELEMGYPVETFASEIVLAEAEADAKPVAEAESSEVVFEDAGAGAGDVAAAPEVVLDEVVAVEDAADEDHGGVEVEETIVTTEKAAPTIAAAGPAAQVEAEVEADEPAESSTIPAVTDASLPVGLPASVSSISTTAIEAPHQPMGSDFFEYGPHDGSGDENVHASGSDYYDEHEEEYEADNRPDILIAFDSISFSLFSLVEANAAELLLEGREEELSHAPLSNLLVAIREECELDEGRKDLLTHGEMCLGEENMGLYVGEDNHYAHTITLAQLLDLFKGCQIEGPMTLSITFEHDEDRFITRFRAIEREVLAQADHTGLEPDEIDELGDAEHGDADEQQGEDEFDEEEEAHEPSEQVDVPLPTAEHASGDADADARGDTSAPSAESPVPAADVVEVLHNIPETPAEAVERLDSTDDKPREDEAADPETDDQLDLVTTAETDGARAGEEATGDPVQELTDASTAPASSQAAVLETSEAAASMSASTAIDETTSAEPAPADSDPAAAKAAAEIDSEHPAVSEKNAVDAPAPPDTPVDANVDDDTKAPGGDLHDEDAVQAGSDAELGQEGDEDELEDDGDDYGIDAVVNAAEKQSEADDPQLDFAGGEVDDEELVGLVEESKEGAEIPEGIDVNDSEPAAVYSPGSSRTLSANGDHGDNEVEAGAIALAHSMLPLEDDAVWAGDDAQDDDFYDPEDEAEWNDGDEPNDDVEADPNADIEDAGEQTVAVGEGEHAEPLGFIPAGLVESRSRSPKRALEEGKDGKAEREVRQKR